jgi:hypothetical protein
MALTHPGLEDAVALHAVGQHVPGQPEVAQHIVAALADGGEEATTTDKSFVPRRTLRYSSRLSGVQGINALRANSSSRRHRPPEDPAICPAVQAATFKRQKLEAF